MRAFVLMIILVFSPTALAIKVDVIAETINELVAELFLYDANRSFEQGDYKVAHDKFIWLAQRGSATAQYSLANLYAQGLGATRDHKKALDWYQQSARQGHVAAQLRLARIYFIGDNVPQDNIRAYAWLYLAAAQGNEAGRKGRQRVARLMAPEQLAAARELARSWMQRYRQR